jgi:hypothetical protein
MATGLSRKPWNMQTDFNNMGKIKDYFQLGEVGGYFFRKKDPSRPNNFNIRAMHGINKLSMLIFLVALIVMIVRFILRAI